MFLLGGTAFSGKTLLAHLLNQGGVTCLDEPDFHNPAQLHRGLPVLRRLFPDAHLPELQHEKLSYREAVTFLELCERAVSLSTLGMKTAGRSFVEYARIYREAGYPVIGMIRDIRDVLAEAPLPKWIDGEPDLNRSFRMVWANLDVCGLVIRYEDLVADPAATLSSVAKFLGRNLSTIDQWTADTVDPTMFKLDRHDMLRDGRISQSRVGIWKTGDRGFSPDTLHTAAMMGYEQ